MCQDSSAHLETTGYHGPSRLKTWQYPLAVACYDCSLQPPIQTPLQGDPRAVPGFSFPMSAGSLARTVGIHSGLDDGLAAGSATPCANLPPCWSCVVHRCQTGPKYLDRQCLKARSSKSTGKLLPETALCF